MVNTLFYTLNHLYKMRAYQVAHNQIHYSNKIFLLPGQHLKTQLLPISLSQKFVVYGSIPHAISMLKQAVLFPQIQKFKNASAFLLRDARHAMHDIFLLRISAILPEAISDGGLTPTTDTNLLLATYRGGSHFTSDIS